MKLVNGLSYRQWQKRNTLAFKALSKETQKNLRAKGYYNFGWDRVKKSWTLLSEYKIVSLTDYKVKKGDLEGAIALVELESENANKLASKTVENIQQTRQKLDELLNSALDKYSKV
ncbi:hypothetical protein [Myxosarcina sp. GI1]|uniref:hypothetical protein n=1 Tax=Myxosarcina sp. GI1 TaxID=1541065 RepID=UPI000562D79A|nr:hypothetical protein [Myxosarcina sp. GI1]